MEISRHAVIRLVQATRYAHRLSIDSKAFLISKGGYTVADHIAGELFDIICDMIGEKLEPHQNFFSDSVTVQLIEGEMSDEEVAEEIIRMAEKNAPKQPEPRLITRNQFNEMLRKTGGYGTPEGEWK